MELRKEIKVFKQIENINLPLASNPKMIANSAIGSLLVCFDDKNVYIKDWEDEKESFVLILNDLPFIEINPNFFERID